MKTQLNHTAADLQNFAAQSNQTPGALAQCIEAPFNMFAECIQDPFGTFAKAVDIPFHGFAKAIESMDPVTA